MCRSACGVCSRGVWVCVCVCVCRSVCVGLCVVCVVGG